MINTFDVERSKYSEIESWCTAHFGRMGIGRWGRSRLDMRNMHYHTTALWRFWFYEDDDAVLFRMTWDVEDNG